MQSRSLALLGLLLAFAVSLPAACSAQAEKIVLGTGGQASANLWPTLIAIKKGFYAAEGLDPEILYVQSSAALVQQLTAGSLQVSISTGLADPLHAVEMGAPISIIRLEIQVPPFDLVAKPGIKSIKDLKGKIVSLGGPKDITRIYIERMLAPNGLHPDDIDMVFAGSTGARASALLAGAVDAAILLPPFNFRTQAKGFHSLGLVVDYVNDIPFSATVVNRTWAGAHRNLVLRLLQAQQKGIDWFEDVANRAEAIRVLQAASGLSEGDVEQSYDLFRNHHFFETSGTISRVKLRALAAAMSTLGDLPRAIDIDKALSPDITKVIP
jgi:ABC-type nitrate/sulfonate/bicarbonate transport system substrate-binding protein